MAQGLAKKRSQTVQGFYFQRTPTAKGEGRGKAKQGDSEASEVLTKEPRSLGISKDGIATAEDFASLMSSVMSDVIDGRLSPPVANAVCNAGGKLLKVVEMQYKYAGKPSQSIEQVPPSLQLTGKGKAEG